MKSSKNLPVKRRGTIPTRRATLELEVLGEYFVWLSEI